MIVSLFGYSNKPLCMAFFPNYQVNDSYSDTDQKVLFHAILCYFTLP
jgi:hypothetical protein